MGLIRGRGFGRIPWPTQKLAEAAFDASQQLCAATGGAGRKNKLLNNTQDGHPGLYFWLQPSRHLPAQCPFPWLCCSIKTISVSSSQVLLKTFWMSPSTAGCWTHLGLKETCRTLESEVALWFITKAIYLPLSVRNRMERQKWMNEVQKCYGIGCIVSSFTVDFLCFEIYKITGIIKYHKYTAQTHIKTQNHRTHCTEKTSVSGYFNLSSH